MFGLSLPPNVTNMNFDVCIIETCIDHPIVTPSTVSILSKVFPQLIYKPILMKI